MLEQIALGEIGLAYNYFYSLTPRTFGNILTGFRDRQETDFKTQWEIGRAVAFASIAPYLPKSIKTPQNYLPFPWEAETSETTTQDLEAMETQVAEQNIPFWDRYDAKKQSQN